MVIDNIIINKFILNKRKLRKELKKDLYKNIKIIKRVVLAAFIKNIIIFLISTIRLIFKYKLYIA